MSCCSWLSKMLVYSRHKYGWASKGWSLLAGQRQEQLTNIFSRHALATKRKSPAVEAEPRQPSVKVDKRQRTHEDTPEREGLDDLFA